MSSDTFLDKKWFKKLDFQTQQLINREGLDRKTIDEVFDKSTLHILGKLISDRIIDSIDFPISTGKEAIVFRALTPQKKYIALKIYRTSNTTYKHIAKYIIGDPRFRYATKSRRELIFQWAQKEFKNLERLRQKKLLVPQPHKIIKNVLVMQYLGTKNTPAPLLKETIIQNPKHICRQLLNNIKEMYQKAELVHADLSPYNIVIYRQKPYIIDVSQAVLTEHPHAQDFLKRDIKNIIQYFKKYGVDNDINHIYEQIIKTKTGR